MDTQIKSDLITELGLGSLPKDKQDELVVKMAEVVFKRMLVETMEKLNIADQEKLGKMIDEKAAPEEIKKFLKEKISNYEEMLEGTISKFKEDMKSQQE